MKKFKVIGGYLILVLTVALFVYYAVTHPKLWHELSQVNIFIILLLLVLYALITFILMLILKYTVRLCSSEIGMRDNFRVTAYSAIVNFFGPLQSGPGFRAIYLKANYKITIKKFLMASVLYYLFFAAISAFFILIGSRLWPLTFIYVPLAVIFGYSAYKYYLNRANKKLKGGEEKLTINLDPVVKLALVTLLQLVIVVIVYFTELRTVNHLITLRQAITYTGVANFALFVSLTPGAIGIREAFLLFTQRLHHIPPNTIIAASFLDRAVYIAFLGALFLVVVSFHFKDKLNLKKVHQVENEQV